MIDMRFIIQGDYAIWWPGFHDGWYLGPVKSEKHMMLDSDDIWKTEKKDLNCLSSYMYPGSYWKKEDGTKKDFKMTTTENNKLGGKKQTVLFQNILT